MQSGDVGPHGLARGRRRKKESHSWQMDIHTEIPRDEPMYLKRLADGDRSQRGRVAEVELRGLRRAAGQERRRGVAPQPAGKVENESNAIQLAGDTACELDDEQTCDRTMRF